MWVRRRHGRRGLRCQVWLFKRPVESSPMRKLLGSVWGTWRGTQRHPVVHLSRGLGTRWSFCWEMVAAGVVGEGEEEGEKGKKGRGVKEKGEDKRRGR